MKFNRENSEVTDINNTECNDLSDGHTILLLIILEVYQNLSTAFCETFLYRNTKINLLEVQTSETNCFYKITQNKS
jgi:hypothetical protein